LAKPEWGTKRQCSSCGSRFYDLSRTPIVCPKCGAAYEGEVTFKSRRSSQTAEAKAPAPAKVIDAVIDIDDALIVLDDEDEIDGTTDGVEEEDESLIEDASDLGEDDDDMAEVMEHLDGEGVDEA